MNRYLRYSIPLITFAVIAAFLLKGLGMNPREIPSPLIGKSIPAFSLPLVDQAQTIVTEDDLLGEVYLLNVWATWCASCRVEHAALVELANSGKVTIHGLNWKDERDKATAWLRQLGNPYSINIFDKIGRTAIDLGVYGAPETFVVDKAGIIHYKHAGPLTPDLISQKILPLVNKLQSEG